MRNEEHTITSVLRSLARQERISDCQVIVVDGHSQDDTVDVAARFPFVRVVSCEPGRARQFNFGASHAVAPLLWFLHADSTLPEKRTVDALMDAAADEDVVGGAFRFHVRGDDAYFSVVNALVNWRAKLGRRPYGDQGIFVKSNAFRTIGGFRELACCEDLDLVLRIRKLGKFKMLRQTVETSARTWVQYGKIRTTAFHIGQMVSFETRRVLGLIKERPQLEAPATTTSVAENIEPLKTDSSPLPKTATS